MDGLDSLLRVKLIVISHYFLSFVYFLYVQQYKICIFLADVKVRVWNNSGQVGD